MPNRRAEEKEIVWVFQKDWKKLKRLVNKKHLAGQKDYTMADALHDILEA